MKLKKKKTRHDENLSCRTAMFEAENGAPSKEKGERDKRALSDGRRDCGLQSVRARWGCGDSIEKLNGCQGVGHDNHG